MQACVRSVDFPSSTKENHKRVLQYNDAIWHALQKSCEGESEESGKGTYARIL